MGRAKQYYDVVLVQPNVTWVYDPFEHLGLAYLGAALRREGFSVLIVDAVLRRLSMSELYEELDKYRIGVLGVTLISHGYLMTVRLLQYYRERHRETKIVGGGHFATFAAPKILEHTSVFDAIVLGEGEISFPRYCRAELSGEPADYFDIARPQHPTRRSETRIVEMDSLPFPARDNLPLAMERGANPGVTSSRGCYARCAFCTVHNFYKARNGPKWISRSIDNVIEELRQLKRDHDMNHFMFVDDNFMGPGDKSRRRALEFAEAYRRSGLSMTFHMDCRAIDVREDVLRELVASGLRSVFVGIESVSASDLLLYVKDLKVRANWEAAKLIKSLGLDYTLSMIMFNPETTEKEILENVRFLEDAEYYPRNPLSILNLYEGTDLITTYKDQVYGPFWDYRFECVSAKTRRIYDAAMQFCKDTLPLERELSARPGTDVLRRRQVYRARLQFLGDVTANIDREPLDSIRARWDRKIDQLRSDFDVSGARTARESRFGVERLYLTGSELDPPAANRNPACEVGVPPA